jgi:hypothetical protein
VNRNWARELGAFFAVDACQHLCDTIAFECTGGRAGTSGLHKLRQLLHESEPPRSRMKASRHQVLWQISVAAIDGHIQRLIVGNGESQINIKDIFTYAMLGARNFNPSIVTDIAVTTPLLGIPTPSHSCGTHLSTC